MLLLLAVPSGSNADGFRLADDPSTGALWLFEGDHRVLGYRYGDQIEKGVNAKYTRSCYIHPLYDLDGKVMTDDFPPDHRHHRGVFWTWPRMKARGKSVQTWHPSNPPLRQYFCKWLKRQANALGATLSVQNDWRLEGEVVGRETVTLQAHPATATARAIDITLTFEAVGGPVELLGAKKKGYGGLCIRMAPSFKGAAMTTDVGPLRRDSTNVPHRWADLSAHGCGLAVLVHPTHPDYPPTWLIRNSYAGILNVSWPGLNPYTLKVGKPITLRYRLYIHRGDAAPAKVGQVYAAYAERFGQ